MKNFKISMGLAVLAIPYIGLSFLIHNPHFASTLLMSIEGTFKKMADSPNLISWLSLAGTLIASFAAITSAIATKKASDIAKSSRDIAKNALSFQYHDSINESIELIVTTLISEKKININATNKISVSNTNYTLSLMRTDWLFAAQEVRSIIKLINAIAIDADDEMHLMERYGRILERKLSVVNGTKGGTLFTGSTPNSCYIYSKIEKKPEINIRDEDLFVVYLFTEEYSSYIVGSGQYPTSNICNYFNKLSSLKLS